MKDTNENRYLVKTYLVDCIGFAVGDLDGMGLEELCDMVDDMGELCRYLDVSPDYFAGSTREAGL